VYYQLESSGHVMYAFMSDPDRTEVNAFRHGKVELAVYVDPPAVFMLAQLGALPWIDAPFSWHLVPDAFKPSFSTADASEREQPGSETLLVVLADARNTIVRALRIVTMPAAVSGAVRAAMRAQAVSAWDPRAYDIALAAITNRLDTQAMLRAAQARGRAGT
jgi:hypothetical protein